MGPHAHRPPIFFPTLPRKSPLTSPPLPTMFSPISAVRLTSRAPSCRFQAHKSIPPFPFHFPEASYRSLSSRLCAATGDFSIRCHRACRRLLRHRWPCVLPHLPPRFPHSIAEPLPTRPSPPPTDEAPPPHRFSHHQRRRTAASPGRSSTRPYSIFPFARTPPHTPPPHHGYLTCRNAARPRDGSLPFLAQDRRSSPRPFAGIRLEFPPPAGAPPDVVVGKFHLPRPASPPSLLLDFP